MILPPILIPKGESEREREISPYSFSYTTWDPNLKLKLIQSFQILVFCHGSHHQPVLSIAPQNVAKLFIPLFNCQSVNYLIVPTLVLLILRLPDNNLWDVGGNKLNNIVNNIFLVGNLILHFCTVCFIFPHNHSPKFECTSLYHHESYPSFDMHQEHPQQLLPYLCNIQLEHGSKEAWFEKHVVCLWE